MSECLDSEGGEWARHSTTGWRDRGKGFWRTLATKLALEGGMVRKQTSALRMMPTKPPVITPVLSDSTSILSAGCFPRFVLQRKGRLGAQTQLISIFDQKKTKKQKTGGQTEQQLGDHCDRNLEDVHFTSTSSKWER